MRVLLVVILILFSYCLFSQPKSVSGEEPVHKVNTTTQLDEVVVTGQFEPKSAKHAVYSVRTISSEQIRLRNANNLYQILNTEPGIRFNNDLALGTSDISLMGISGKGVKVLLDGVPMSDRGEIRESLGQIDINTIERIEIVEGPMSVSYGTDALGGVINVVTKKGARRNELRITAKVQEETAGKEYSGFGSKGAHNQNVSLAYNRNRWDISVSTSQSDFGGWKGLSQGRQLDWNPKKQYLTAIQTGYNSNHFSTWYRLNMVDETITLYGETNPAKNTATDKDYISRRFFHQAQADWIIGPGAGLSIAASYTDYSRRTKTTILNTLNGDRRLSPDSGSQDKSFLNQTFLRATMQYKISENISFQPGVEMNLNGSSGDRILGSPRINDYAFFASSELGIGEKISIRPGFRVIRNSVYKAPPLIPAINALFKVSDELDWRLAYAKGFRAPSLRELYFNFFDSSHAITGNTSLKAEYSNSFNSSLAWRNASLNLPVTVTLSGFYNIFRDLIETGISTDRPGVYSYVNIGRSKTLGGSVQTAMSTSRLKGNLGFSYIGRYNRLSSEAGTSLPEFNWSPELNSNLIYSFPRIGVHANLAYKFNGKLPVYELREQNGQQIIAHAKTSSYNLSDFSLRKDLKHFISVLAGVKNLFNVTRVTNTSAIQESAHNSGGPVPVSYGRSFFMGLSFQWSKNLSNK